MVIWSLLQPMHTLLILQSEISVWRTAHPFSSSNSDGISRCCPCTLMQDFELRCSESFVQSAARLSQKHTRAHRNEQAEGLQRKKHDELKLHVIAELRYVSISDLNKREVFHCHCQGLPQVFQWSSEVFRGLPEHSAAIGARGQQMLRWRQNTFSVA